MESRIKDEAALGFDDLENMTPMLRQYFNLKQQAPEAVLFFRMGDFYEIFGKDAEEVAPLLEIVLTSRDRTPIDKNLGESKQGNKIPFCGVPHHSAKNYWLRLLKKGKKVAIADQVEDANLAKGLVKREITKILSPGIIEDIEGLESDSHNYVVGVSQKPGTDFWAVAVIELSIGELRCGELENFAEVIQFVRITTPKEILTRKVFRDEIFKSLHPVMGESTPIIGELSEGVLRDQYAQKKFVSELSMDSGNKALEPHSLGLIAAMLNHLDNMKVCTAVFKCIRPLKEPETMNLDETVIRDLEIFETSRRRDTEGALYRVMNSTLSPMGARLLRRSLLEPLINRKKIDDRLNMVALLKGFGEEFLSNLRGKIKGIPDLERVSLRLRSDLIQPADIAKIRMALRKIKEVSSELKAKSLKFEIESCAFEFKSDKELSLLEASLEEQPQALGLGYGVFKAGFDADLDQKKHYALKGEALIQSYQERLREETGISSLKIKPQKNYGLLIEVTKANRQKIPKEFIHRQTMVNSDRFSTPELQDLSEKLDKAQSLCVEREMELYSALLTELRKIIDKLRELAKEVALVDMLVSFAWNALKNRLVAPKWSQRDLILKGSRHPVVEQSIGEHEFCANDIILTGKFKQILITGPNMAGKSTLMRQVALTALMAQVGSFVPANEALMPVFDRIFTRVGASDDLAKGQSTFMVEMSEAAHILRAGTKNSLVILDEIGRGTSSQDGLALAAAILGDIAKRVQCYTLFATHYHELVDYVKDLDSVIAMQTEVLEHGESILFTHRLKGGATSASYGIEVARIAGIPKHVVQLAKKIAIETGFQKPGVIVDPQREALDSNKESVGVKKKKEFAFPLEDHGLLTLESQEAQSFFPKLEKIRKLNLYKTTPIQALNILAELQEAVASTWQSQSRHEEVLS